MVRFWPRALVAIFVAGLWVCSAFAANFPALTGRVVDAAGILSPITAADLERKLAVLEQKSGIQLVVATVPSLDGQEIEPYANQLFRTWKLGESKKDNGALLLIAPKERRVRIEVGYGLEGTMTDAVSGRSSRRRSRVPRRSFDSTTRLQTWSTLGLSVSAERETTQSRMCVAQWPWASWSSRVWFAYRALT